MGINKGKHRGEAVVKTKALTSLFTTFLFRLRYTLQKTSYGTGVWGLVMVQVFESLIVMSGGSVSG